MKVYEIYAVRYAGPLTSSGALLMWMKDWDKSKERNYYFWYIKGDGVDILVDTGVSPELAKSKNVPSYTNPAEMLCSLNLHPDTIKHVVLTHMHWDHASGIKLFPKAKVYVQKKEYLFWLKDEMAARPPFKFLADEATNTYLSSLEGSTRMVLLDGDTKILPGIECLLAPGHTVALQAVAVNTAKGTAIIGSDCAHVFQNYQEEWPSSIFVDMAECLRSYDKLKKKVSSIDLLFPGHDRLMSSNYPKVSKGITRLV